MSDVAEKYASSERVERLRHKATTHLSAFDENNLRMVE